MSKTMGLTAKLLMMTGVAGAMTLGSSLAAQAGNVGSINATQVSIDVAPISISGTRLGGYVEVTGKGLNNVPTLSTLDNTGALSASSAITTLAGATFNYDVYARAADAVAVAAVGGAAPTSAFGSQSGSYSSGVGTGALAIGVDNSATITAGNQQGATYSAIASVTMSSAENQNQVRRVATSVNKQSTFTTERQSSRFQLGGSGLDAVTAGGTMGAAALGATPASTVATGGAVASAAGVDFTRTNNVRTGQAGTAVIASSTDVTQPAYGTFANTVGGTTAGAINGGAAFGINALTVLGGGAGTSSSLSLIQSLSAF